MTTHDSTTHDSTIHPGGTAGPDGGPAAVPVARPATLAEAVSALAGSTGRVLLRGTGTATDWAGRAEPADLVLDTTALSGVITHNPGDMTVGVHGGTPLRELNATLAEHGQRVALDAARIDRGATVGGLVATADAGPAALVHGSPRDLVIGATVVLADGTAARTGGHVIKNVAGYDLAKLVHGSHGTLALIAEVVLRLHPVPPATATVRWPARLPEAARAAAAVLASPLEPSAVEWCGDGLLVRLEGSAAALGPRTERLLDLLGDSADGPPQRLAEVDAVAEWAEHAAVVDARPDDAAMLRIGCRPSRLPGVLTELVHELGASRVTAGLATGVGTMALAAEPAAVARAHEIVHAAGGTSMLRGRPAGSRAPGWGPAPSSIAVLRAVKAELDPEGRLGAGRFSPWM
ncbi:MAG TPA: FAD-binding protein [Pseudonocardia sp.]